MLYAVWSGVMSCGVVVLPLLRLATKTVADLRLKTPLTVQPDVTCEQCVQIFNKEGYDQLPVIAANGDVLGMVSANCD